MTDSSQPRSDIETTIRTRLIELIRLSFAHGIDVQALMEEALDSCDPDPPFCN